MSQSRRSSLAESIANLVAGYLVSLAVQIVTFPMFGMQPTIGENLSIGAIFSVASVVRSYALRRAFNRSGKDFSQRAIAASSKTA